MLEIFVILLCIFLNAFLAAVEMAFVSIGRPELRRLARAGNKEASKILKLRDKPERTLSIIQIGITLVGAIAAAVGGAGAQERIKPFLILQFDLSPYSAGIISIAVIVLPITLLNVVIGELVPKSLALRNPISIVLKSATSLSFLDRLLAPLVTMLEASTKAFLNIFFRKSKHQQHTETSTQVAEQLDLLSFQHREYVFNLVNIEKKRVREIALDWEKVHKVHIAQSIEEIETIVLTSGHTRLPVIDDDLKIVGILHTKEFLAYRKMDKSDWTSLVRPALNFQGGDSLLKALKTLQQKRSHLGIIYSGPKVIGIVTLEDIIEEIIGDIFDEDDDGSIRNILTNLRTYGVASNSK